MANYTKYYQKAVELYRKLHQTPEIGFDLYETVKIVKEELDAIGIPYTEKYGKCSVVAEIGNGDKIIALRADMDALPIEEQSGVPFTSKNKGAMHACGHDSHTAILLAVASLLKDNEDKLKIKVRLIFQPSEEGSISGAKMLVDNGVTDGVSQIICTHVETNLPWGVIGTHKGDYMAACVPLTITFLGKSSHATLPEQGIDAIAMANEAYTQLKKAVESEADGQKYIWSVGKFSGGSVHNVICNNCEMAISFRFYNLDFAERMKKRTFEICNKIANDFGGEVNVDWHISTFSVINDEKLVADFEKAIKQENLTNVEVPSRMSSEDFGWYLQNVKGFIFRYGIYNEEFGVVAVPHTCNFKVYEPAMESAIRAFYAYLMHLNGEN